eukprot:4909146-Pyramimonas_sp.AAC.1
MARSRQRELPFSQAARVAPDSLSCSGTEAGSLPVLRRWQHRLRLCLVALAGRCYALFFVQSFQRDR